MKKIICKFSEKELELIAELLEKRKEQLELEDAEDSNNGKEYIDMQSPAGHRFVELINIEFALTEINLKLQ